jgi:hypothetical protein
MMECAKAAGKWVVVLKAGREVREFVQQSASSQTSRTAPP